MELLKQLKLSLTDIGVQSIALPVKIKTAGQIMFDCKRIERLDVGVKSEEVLLRLGLADNWTRLLDTRRGGEAPAIVITMTPDQSRARGLRGVVISGAP